MSDHAHYDIAALRRDLEGIAFEGNPRLVLQKSRDFFWYSPILKRDLDAVTGDLVVKPANEAEVVRVLSACFARDIPLTPRGAGTGNYGQAMPLSGGVVLDLARLDRIGEIGPGRVKAGAGAIIADIDAAARATSGQELRMHPSTARTATIGGFVAGGSGGVGSINWGSLRDFGNILSLRVISMEANPRIMTLSGFDLHKVSHAYGTNGVITEVEMALAPAYDWIDVLAGHEGFVAAAHYGDALGNQDGILVKEIGVIAAPIGHNYFHRHQKFISPETSVTVVMVAPHAMDAFVAFSARSGAQILYRSELAVDRTGLTAAYELAWNHTTLRALRVDPAITYLQVLYPFPDQIALVEKLHARFGDEIMGHLEFVRLDGKITCFGLPLVRFSDEARLDEIISIHEDMGAPVFNPHRYTLEEGGMKQTDEVQLSFKHKTDPKGLLNPGKMIAFHDPDFNYSTRQTYLFPALAQSG